MSKLARLEAETSEIISDGSNDEMEAEFKHDYNKDLDETESGEEKSDNENIRDDEEEQEGNKENNSHKSSSNNGSERKSISDGELSNDENVSKSKSADDKSVKSLDHHIEDISSDGTLDEKKSQDSHYIKSG
jgi:hypothetical protein